MNIFVLSNNPWEIPRHYCDIHLRCMIKETAQLLCGVHVDAPYKRTHYNHPCSKWTRRTAGNYEWLFSLFLAMHNEYIERNDKEHLSFIKTHLFLLHNLLDVPTESDSMAMTPFAQCMPDQYKHVDPIVAYRRYYAAKLRDFRSRGLI